MSVGLLYDSTAVLYFLACYSVVFFDTLFYQMILAVVEVQYFIVERCMAALSTVNEATRRLVGLNIRQATYLAMLMATRLGSK